MSLCNTTASVLCYVVLCCVVSSRFCVEFRRKVVIYAGRVVVCVKMGEEIMRRGVVLCSIYGERMRCELRGNLHAFAAFLLKLHPAKPKEGGILETQLLSFQQILRPSC